MTGRKGLQVTTFCRRRKGHSRSLVHGNFDATYDDVLKGCTALLNEILDTEKFTKEN